MSMHARESPDLSPQALCGFRSCLRFLARVHLADDLRGRLDPSDVVQETLARAVAAPDQFRGTTRAELRAWLRTILAAELGRAGRDARRQRRDVRRERPLDAAMESSALRLEQALASLGPSPDEQAERHEAAAALAEAIEALPAQQQDVVIRHYWRGQTLATVAAETATTRPAVAGLLFRATRSLRTVLERFGADD